jgi:hypothetical protein
VPVRNSTLIRRKATGQQAKLANTGTANQMWKGQ